MPRALDIDDEEERRDRGPEATGEKPNFVILPFIMPMPIFKMLNTEAVRSQTTVAGLMTKALQEYLDRAKKER